MKTRETINDELFSSFILPPFLRRIPRRWRTSRRRCQWRCGGRSHRGRRLPSTIANPSVDPCRRRARERERRIPAGEVPPTWRAGTKRRGDAAARRRGGTTQRVGDKTMPTAFVRWKETAHGSRGLFSSCHHIIVSPSSLASTATVRYKSLCG